MKFKDAIASICSLAIILAVVHSFLSGWNIYSIFIVILALAVLLQLVKSKGKKKKSAKRKSKPLYQSTKPIQKNIPPENLTPQLHTQHADNLLRILDDCVYLASSSKNPKTRESRLEVGIEKALELKRLESEGLYSGKPTARSYLKTFNDIKVSNNAVSSLSMQSSISSHRSSSTVISKTVKLAPTITRLPVDVLNLLWFVNGPNKNYEPESSDGLSIDFEGVTIKVQFDHRTEPSLIDLDLPVSKPQSPVPKPDYFPSYKGLTPQQRFVYLNWLLDVKKPIDIGYVFIFYYGLERHLLFGKFEEAFHMILKLREYHNNSSFSQYSGDALLLSIMIRCKPDWIKHIDLSKVSHDVRLFVLAGTVKCFEARDIMDAHKKFSFDNKRYISGYPELFESTLKDNLQNTFGKPAFPILHEDINYISGHFTMAIANYSLLPEQRFIQIPDITTSPRVQTTINKILTDTHEQVKVKLRDIRKKERENTVSGKDV